MTDTQIEKTLEMLQETAFSNYYIAKKTGFSQSIVGVWRRKKGKPSKLNATILQQFFNDEMRGFDENLPKFKDIKGNNALVDESGRILGKNNLLNEGEIAYLFNLIEEKERIIKAKNETIAEQRERIKELKDKIKELKKFAEPAVGVVSVADVG